MTATYPTFVGLDDDATTTDTPVDVGLLKQIAENSWWCDTYRKPQTVLVYNRAVDLNIPGPAATLQVVPNWHGVRWHLRGPFPYWAPAGTTRIRAIVSGPATCPGLDVGNVAVEMIGLTQTSMPRVSEAALDDVVRKSLTTTDQDFYQPVPVAGVATADLNGIACDGGYQGAWRWVYFAVRSAFAPTADTIVLDFGQQDRLKYLIDVNDELVLLGAQPRAWIAGDIDAVTNLPVDRRGCGTVMYYHPLPGDNAIYIAEAPSEGRLTDIITGIQNHTGGFGRLGSIQPESITIDPNSVEPLPPMERASMFPGLRYWRPVGVRNVGGLLADTNRSLEMRHSQVTMGPAQRGEYGGQWRVFNVGPNASTGGVVYTVRHWNQEGGVGGGAGGQSVAYEAQVPIAYVMATTESVRNVDLVVTVYDEADAVIGRVQVTTALTAIIAAGDGGSLTAAWAYLATLQYGTDRFGMEGEQKVTHDGAVWPSEAWSFFTPVTIPVPTSAPWGNDDTHRITLTVNWGLDPNGSASPSNFAALVVGNWGVRAFSVAS